MTCRPTRDVTKLQLISQPFLLVRLIIFLILGFLNILALAFSVWSITSARTFGYEGSDGASFALFNSCLYLFMGSIAFANALFPCTVNSLVKFEIGWTGVLSILDLAASIMTTREGLQLMCQPGISNNVCTPSIALVPVSWLAFTFLISYFAILLVLSITHRRVYQNLYNIPISSVPWFQIDHDACVWDEKLTSAIKTQPTLDLFGTEEYDVGDADVEKQAHGTTFAYDPAVATTRKDMMLGAAVGSWRKARSSVLSFTPQWAKDLNGMTRRGITNPFKLPVQQPRVPDAPTGNEQRGENPERLSYWIGQEVMVPPHDAHVCHRVGEGLYEVDRNRNTATHLPPPRATTPLSYAWSATRREEKRMGILLDDDEVRQSVSSMFPSSVKEDEWNRPLKKPPFKNGLGEGWRTADNSKVNSKVRGWRTR